MKFGSKGVEPTTIIAIIGGVFVLGILIFVLIVRAIRPFTPMVDRGQCLTELLGACGTGHINRRGTINVNEACNAIKDINDNCGYCIRDGCSIGEPTFDNCCPWIRGQPAPTTKTPTEES